MWKRALFFSLLVTIPLQAVTVVPEHIEERLALWNGSKEMTSGVVGVFQAENLVYTKSFGYADWQAKTPFTIDTPFLVCSITKQMTAVALLELLQMKGLPLPDALHWPISHFLSTSDPFWEGKAPLWIDQVTLHGLLTHTSGLPDFDIERWIGKIPLAATPQQLLQIILQSGISLADQPSFCYSNIGYHLLGVVIEKQAGVSLEQVFETRLFKPAGMADAGLLTRNGALLTRSYLRDPNSLEEKETQGFPLSWAWSSGGVVASARDLVKWNLWLYQGPWAALLTESRVALPSMWGLQQEYGYGIAIHPDPERHFWHRGHLPGWRHHLIWFPDSSVTLVVGRNITWNKGEGPERATLDFATPVYQTILESNQ